jgi:hypothetical protein
VPGLPGTVSRNGNYRGNGGWRSGGDGAACQNRTDDLLITSEMLYRLS